MKKFGYVVLLLLLVATPALAKSDSSSGGGAAGNYTIGLGPIGNFYLTDRHPEMNPGVGAIIYFDYRWSPELSTTASVMMLVQDGRDSEAGSGSIVFLGLPTFDVKYYFITNPSRWDPYVGGGIGYYAVTTGSQGRGAASGLGAQAGGGFDYYLTQKLSLGLASYFRSIGLLGNGATGSFPISILGNFGYHF